MTALPDRLDRKQHVDLEHRDLEWWLTGAGALLLAAFLALALANVFGQKVQTATASAPAADLEVRAPTAVRSGLIYEVQFTVAAHRTLEEPTLVLDSGWFDGFTINTMSPDTKDWVMRDGRNVMSYDAVPAGTELVVRLQYQVNPTTFGTRDQGVVLEDARHADPHARPRDDHLSLMDIVIRAAVIFVFIWMLMRVIGRRELSSMEPFDLIMLVVIGDLVQQGVTQQDLSVTGALLAAATIGLLTVLLAWFNYRFPRLRPALEGRPVVLVEDGKAIEPNLKRERITLEELAAQARLKEIDSISDVRWAVLETSGAISFIPRSK